MSRYLLLVPFCVWTMACAASSESGGTNPPGAGDTGSPLEGDVEDSGSSIDSAVVVTDSAVTATDSIVAAADSAVAGDSAKADTAPPSDECKGYPFSTATLLAERLGFGAAATGGEKVYHVTSLANAGTGTLRAALESTESYWIVFDVEGVILLDEGSVRVKSNKTVDGRGRSIVIDGNLKIDAGTKNLIFSDVALQYPRGWKTSDGDTIGIRGHAAADPAAYDSKDFWFHHLDLGRAGDGQLDVRGGTNITISWSHMHSHAKSFLHSQDTDSKPSPGMRITYHHNWFDGITRRGPLFYYGYADYFNNWQYHWYEFGASSNSGAQFLSENNIYEARPGTYCIPSCPDPNSPTGDSDYTVSKEALVSGWAGEPGYIRSVGDLAQEGAKITTNEPTKVFTRAAHYAAKPDPAGPELKARLKASTGPRKTYCK